MTEQMNPDWPAQVLPVAPFLPFMNDRMAHLPGVQPLNPAEWLVRDAVFAAQMRYRDHLVATQRDQVLAETPAAEPALRELLAMLVQHLLATDKGYVMPCEHALTRPDGVTLALRTPPVIETLARLVQEDLCILEADGEEYKLTAATLCFPSRWSLSEKMGRRMSGIHTPVPDYVADVARRVNRMFTAIRPEAPLWRGNYNIHALPELYQPGGSYRDQPVRADFLWLRVERQTFVRLPVSRAIVFGIKTFVSPVSSLQPDQAARLATLMRARNDDEIAYRGRRELHDTSLMVLDQLAARPA